MKNTRLKQTDNTMIAPIGEDQNNAPADKSDHVDRYEPRSLDTPLIDWVRHYRSMGWVPIPIHDISAGHCSCKSNLVCRSQGKHPRVMRSDAIEATEETWGRWIGTWPNMNIGILTGTESGIFAIDIDPRHRGDVSITELTQQFGTLPRTLTAATGGGGCHLVYQIPSRETVKSTANVIANGVDVRGEGGIIVVEPSKTSGDYKWL